MQKKNTIQHKMNIQFKKITTHALDYNSEHHKGFKITIQK